MWKCITRNVRENLERRICSSLTDRSNQDAKQCNFGPKYIPSVTNIVCGNSFTEFNNDSRKQRLRELKVRRTNCDYNRGKEKTQRGSWDAEHQVRQSWLNALGWTTALVLSWNLAQPLCKSLSEKRHWCPFSRRPPPFMCWKNKKFHHIRRAHWPFHRPSPLQDDAYGNWNNVQYDPRNFYSHQDGPDGKWGYKYTPPDSQSWEDEVDSKWSEEYDPRVQKCESVSGHESNYASIWKVLSHTLAQPSHILPKKTETQNQKIHVQNVELTVYGPPTAEQALDEAAQNLAEAQKTVLGDTDNHIGVELMQNGKHHEAVTMFSKAADMDNAAAAYNLAICHEKGLGTNQDFKKAAKYYQLASERGHATAMYNLGVFHTHGWGGLPADCDRAHELFRRASELGQPDAKKALGMAEAEKHPLARGMDEPDGSAQLVMQAMGVAQKLILGVPNDKSQPDLLDVDINYYDKDISDLVHNSILKYTEMLQK